MITGKVVTLENKTVTTVTVTPVNIDLSLKG